jgi:hypothetical protein
MTDGTPEAADPDAERRRKFREALERKRGKEVDRNAARSKGAGPVHEATGPAQSRRPFRRKSGG